MKRDWLIVVVVVIWIIWSILLVWSLGRKTKDPVSSQDVGEPGLHNCLIKPLEQTLT